VQTDAGQHRPQPCELAVLGAKVVAPLADAVRFVDRHERHGAAAQQLQKPIAALSDEPLRRHVQQPQAPVSQLGQHARLFVSGERTVVARRRDAIADQRIDLILHQRDERGHDDGEAIADEGGRLEAERLAAAGRQHDDRITVRQNRVHRLALQRTERGITPVAL
jgi:hypothetical protein